MATFDDAKRDASDLAKLVNEDTDVTTRYGTNPKVSAPKAIRLIEASGTETVNQIQTDAANAIATLNTSRGFRDVGDFATGFTYELPNDVAIDGSGNYWAYADINALPVTVPAGTTPTEGEYSQRTWNEASAVVTAAGINAQQFIDNFELKIFQSPTDNLTKVSTFAGGVGVVYEVRKTSDNSLATIYSDKDGLTSIPQNGTANVSNGDAEAVFYIDKGDFYVTINSVSAQFDTSKRSVAVDMEAATLGTPATASNDHALFKSTYGPFRMHMEPDRPIENGTVSKLDWMLDPYDGGDLVPYPNADVNYRIFNVFTKTGDEIGLNGENGAAVIGTKNRADGETWGLFTSMHFGFNDGKAVPMKMYYMDHSDTEWRTPMKNFWYTSKPLNANDYVLSGRRLYKCLTTGVCGATQPTHLSGTASDGNLDFEFIRDYMDHTNDIDPVVLFGTRDLMPKFGHQSNPLQIAAEPLIWSGVRVKHLSVGQQSGFGLVKSGVRTDSESWQLEFYNNNRFKVFEDRYNTVGMVKQYTTSTLTDSDIVSGQLQIPAGVEQVEVNLTTPTSISSVSALTPHQHITIIDLAGNLTLNDTAKIKTKDGNPLTMRAGTGRTFALSLGGTLIREL